MKTKYFGLIGMLIIFAACGKGGDSNPPGGKGSQSVGQAGGKFPAYANDTLAGNVLGAAWQARAAGWKKTAAGHSIVVYGDAIDACSTVPATTAPIANVDLKDVSSGRDFVFDMASGQTSELTVTFTKPNTIAIAELAKAQISGVSAGGFRLSLFAKSTGEGGAVSQVNGQVEVVDCAKRFDFANWTALIGQYKLLMFDGRDLRDDWQMAVISADQSITDGSGRTLDMTKFPLYYSVSSGGSASYNFGPINQIGISSMSEAGSDRTLTYDVSENVVFRGTNCKLILHIEVKASDSGRKLEIAYTLEIPGYESKTSHNFVLRKF